MEGYFLVEYVSSHSGVIYQIGWRCSATLVFRFGFSFGWSTE